MSEPATPDSEPVGGVLVEERAAPTEVEPGDHERFSHYVQKEKILESAVTGTPVVALCGKVWLPNRDPQRFPVCPDCKRIYEGLPPGGDDAGGGGGESGE